MVQHTFPNKLRINSTDDFPLRSPCARSGISLIEVLVVIGVIALLVGLLAPAVASVREAGRRMQCQSNLRQIGIGLNSYETTFGVYPDGIFWSFTLLPHIGFEPVYLKYNLPSGTLPVTPSLDSVRIPLYSCPSDPAVGVVANSYMGCYGSGIIEHGFNGVFNHWANKSPQYYPQQPIGSRDVTDGTSNTAAIAEILHSDNSEHRLRVRWQLPRSFNPPNELDALADFCEGIPENATSLGWRGSTMGRGTPWWFGNFGEGLYNHVLPPNRPSCNNGTNLPGGAHSAGSFHGAGANVLYADGHVQFESASIDRRVWREIGSRVDRVIGPDFPN